MLVQALIPEPAIETFDVRVLGRLARIDELKLHAVVIGPSIKGSTSVFGAVINDQNIRVSAFAHDPVQEFRNPVARQ